VVAVRPDPDPNPRLAHRGVTRTTHATRIQ
jgi:hypothetical protein